MKTEILVPHRVLAPWICLLLATALHSPAGAAPKGPPVQRLQELMEDYRYKDVLTEGKALLVAGVPDPALEADVLDLVVEAYRQSGRTTDPEAREMARRAVRLREESAGPDHPDVAESLHTFGSLLSLAGELDEASEVLRRALAIRRTSLGEGHVLVARTLKKLADVQQKQSLFREAASNYGRALRIYEGTPGDDRLQVADVLHGLGNLGVRSGDYVSARESYERALEIYEADEAGDRREASTVKITLGYLLRLTGDLGRARSMLEEAAAETEESLGLVHPLTSHALENLGMVLFAMGEYEGARSAFRKSLESREIVPGPGHVDVATGSLNLGRALRALGRDEEARRLFERALQIYEENVGPNHPDLARALMSLGDSAADAGDASGAAGLYRRSLGIRREALGRSHPETAHSHVALAGALLSSGHRSRALEHAAEAVRILDKHTRETVAFLPEREALLMASGRARPEALLFRGLGGAGGDGEAWLRACWDWALRSRALVLDETVRRHGAVLADKGEAAHRAWQQLVRAREAVAELWVLGPGGVDGDFDEALARARERKEEAELTLARLSAEYGSRRQADFAGVDEVRAALPASSALLEYVRVEVGLPTDRERPRRYFALVLPRKGPLRFVDLGPAGEIDRLVEAWRKTLRISGRILAKGGREGDLLRPVGAAGRRLREAVWDPALSRLGNAERVFVVPDGLLHSVDFHALPARGGGYLIERGPELHLLDAGRDLVRLASSGAGERPRVGAALVVGAPAFGAAAPLRTGANGRGEGGACEPRRGGRWPELPESAREAEAVSRALGPAGRVKVLLGAEAGEARFKKEAPGKDILHLATHGFFLHGECGPHEPSVNPLLLSGLVLAGANNPSPDAGEDGYLTSEELAAMDLRGVNLAVLSACDTGRGRIEPGEGVLGLRRALALAGARTVVMSLWRVPDRQARRWMTSFYEARVEGESIRESVRSAGLTSLERLRRRKVPAHPYLWAGFVAAGDWR